MLGEIQHRLDGQAYSSPET